MHLLQDSRESRDPFDKLAFGFLAEIPFGQRFQMKEVIVELSRLVLDSASRAELHLRNVYKLVSR